PIAVTSYIVNRQDGLDEYRTRFVDKGAADPRKAELFTERVLQPVEHIGGDDRALLGYRCTNSGMTLAVGTDHQIETENEYEVLAEVEEDYAKYIFRIHALPGKKVTITKTVTYHT